MPHSILNTVVSKGQHRTILYCFVCVCVLGRYRKHTLNVLRPNIVVYSGTQHCMCYGIDLPIHVYLDTDRSEIHDDLVENPEVHHLYAYL